MLENREALKQLNKKEAKEQITSLGKEISGLQRKVRTLGIPVMVVVEGWDGSGKGKLINELIQPLDPRGFQVFNIQKATPEEELYPYMRRFWTKLPGRGEIHVFIQIRDYYSVMF